MILLLCTGQRRALFFTSDHFYRRGGGEHAYGLNCASMLLILLLPLFSVRPSVFRLNYALCFFTVFIIWGFFRHCLRYAGGRLSFLGRAYAGCGISHFGLHF